MALPGEEVVGCYTMFDKDNFSMWKHRMLVFLHTLDYDMEEIIDNGPYVPATSVGNKPRDQWKMKKKGYITLMQRPNGISLTRYQMKFFVLLKIVVPQKKCLMLLEWFMRVQKK